MPKKKPTVKPEMGRPKVKIDWEVVDRLCMIRCTANEIAAFMNVDPDTLIDACLRENGKTFSVYFAEKSAKGTMSLRRAQYVAAVENLDSAMLKHLGQHWLGQKPTPESMNLITHIAVSVEDVRKAMAEDPFIDATHIKKEITNEAK